MKKRLLAILLLLVILVLSSCTQESEATGSGDKSSLGNASQGSPPAHPSYWFDSLSELQGALFSPEHERYAEIRSALDSGEYPETLKQREPYARMLTYFENEGVFPVPRILGTVMGSAEAATAFTYYAAGFQMVSFLGLPEILYSVVLPNDSLRLVIELIPLIAAEDQTLQEYTDVEELLAHEGKNLEVSGKTELQLADRTVSAIYRNFGENDLYGRYEYMFLYDGYYVSVIDTQDVLTEEFWSGFSIEMVAKT